MGVTQGVRELCRRVQEIHMGDAGVTWEGGSYVGQCESCVGGCDKHVKGCGSYLGGFGSYVRGRELRRGVQ